MTSFVLATDLMFTVSISINKCTILYYVFYY